MATVAELEQIQTQLRSMNTDISEELSELVATELKRRKRAGRKSTGFDRKTANRLAQQRFRNKKKDLQP